MMKTVHTQSQQNVFTRQSSTANGQQPRSGVWQDNPTAPRARTASQQPAPHKKVMRPHVMNRNSSRSQNRPNPKRKTVHLTLWVKPVVKAELERIAAREGISISATGGTFLEKALQQHIDMHVSSPRSSRNSLMGTELFVIDSNFLSVLKIMAYVHIVDDKKCIMLLAPAWPPSRRPFHR